MVSPNNDSEIYQMFELPTNCMSIVKYMPDNVCCIQYADLNLELILTISQICVDHSHSKFACILCFAYICL